MIIGVPKEIKTKETRVAITPNGVKELSSKGHKVYLEKDAGLNSSFSNEEYQNAGATLEAKHEQVWEKAEMIVKVKEPLESEYKYFRPDLTVFTYLHLASVPPLVTALLKAKTTAIGYETVEEDNGELPLLRPMSEVAGRVATQVGTYLLHSNHGGKGLLLGGVTGTRRGTVVVIGGGYVGLNAAEVASGLRAETIILDISDKKIAYIEDTYNGRIKPIKSSKETIAEWTSKADLLIGAVLVAGDRAPHLVTRDMVKNMKQRSVIVDVSIDQGGCVETSRTTSHEVPTFTEHNVIHYCVPNMPALTPITSTEALTSATLPYVVRIANDGVKNALSKDKVLARGLQTQNGEIKHPVIAKLF
ncbi:MAG: alanine dehydrogenase [Deltaproteobacteria bacterium CG07_land_8_20_14_0_80_38_7]|nr:MAG: alanine dehydrogenase [Deltaproteobacteria bacterium CG07_land_8_20_14_0_80_38_7]